MEPRCEQFLNTSRKALQDPHLQEALRSIDANLRSMRNAAFQELPNAEELREQARIIRDHTLEHLDRYLEQLEDRVMQLGGTVHWAEDAAAARRIVERLAADRGVRTVVKGKSMVSEEIGLNEGLVARGVDVVETDLGEYIIQLACEPPSHIVGPAIHKTKDQIARLFCEALDAPLMEDPKKMALFARRKLRERFLSADMGVTGANFLVASTGALVLLENEGNIRMSTTLPRIHVAVTGIEKVVPTWEDLSVLLKLLPRSTTGQKLSSYVSLFLGPRRPGEPDGADEFHLVLVDNGRSRILADKAFRESLRCIRCGACLNTCPVYLKIGGHAYGWVYSGPIGSILTPQLLKDRRCTSTLPFASTLCGACADVCPVKIDIPRILAELRSRFAEDPEWGPAPLSEHGLFRLAGTVLSDRLLYEGAGSIARTLYPLIRRTGPADTFPPPASRPFRRSHKHKSRKGRKDAHRG
jgi:L-lactate dehydrogenase complex protein LldF